MKESVKQSTITAVRWDCYSIQSWGAHTGPVLQRWMCRTDGWAQIELSGTVPSNGALSRLLLNTSTSSDVVCVFVHFLSTPLTVSVSFSVGCFSMGITPTWSNLQDKAAAMWVENTSLFGEVVPSEFFLFLYFHPAASCLCQTLRWSNCTGAQPGFSRIFFFSHYWPANDLNC